MVGGRAVTPAERREVDLEMTHQPLDHGGAQAIPIVRREAAREREPSRDPALFIQSRISLEDNLSQKTGCDKELANR